MAGYNFIFLMHMRPEILWPSLSKRKRRKFSKPWWDETNLSFWMLISTYHFDQGHSFFLQSTSACIWRKVHGGQQKKARGLIRCWKLGEGKRQESWGRKEVNRKDITSRDEQLEKGECRETSRGIELDASLQSWKNNFYSFTFCLFLTGSL